MVLTISKLLLITSYNMIHVTSAFTNYKYTEYTLNFHCSMNHRNGTVCWTNKSNNNNFLPGNALPRSVHCIMKADCQIDFAVLHKNHQVFPILVTIRSRSLGGLYLDGQTLRVAFWRASRSSERPSTQNNAVTSRSV